MTFGEFADKVREIQEGNEDFGSMEVTVAVGGLFEIPFHDLVFKRGKCVLCDEPSTRKV